MSTNKKCRLLRIEDDRLVFDGGHCLSFDHEQDCCENNYADFSVFDDYVWKFFIFEDSLELEFVQGYGFVLNGYVDALFSSTPCSWPVFVPCYSDQNGYYTTDIDIYFDGNKILSGQCFERII